MKSRYEKELHLLGKRLREIRKEKGLSQIELEISTGIDRSDISKIERGIKNIEFITIVKLAAGLNIHIGEFFPKEQ